MVVEVGGQRTGQLEQGHGVIRTLAQHEATGQVIQRAALTSRIVRLGRERRGIGQEAAGLLRMAGLQGAQQRHPPPEQTDVAGPLGGRHELGRQLVGPAELAGADSDVGRTPEHPPQGRIVGVLRHRELHPGEDQVVDLGCSA